VSNAGSGYAVAGAAGAFYLIGWAAHDTRARETGLLSAQALLNSGIVVTAIKQISRRARPNAGDDRGVFFTEGSSFPSGHTIQAFTLASVVAHEYSDHKWVGWAAYGLASAIGISRFTAQRHYLSDVLVGGALGYAIGRYTYRAHHRLDGTSGTTGNPRLNSRAWPLIAPQFDRRTRAYGVSFSWIY
jgi:membrane-associated phospholipid phosphatase